MKHDRPRSASCADIAKKGEPARPYSDCTAVLATPFGAFGIVTHDACIQELLFLPPDTPARSPADALAARAVTQILGWLEDPDAPFDLPLAARGTPFQQRVWQGIRNIPRGEVQTYGQLAARIGSAARAVGQACGANPFPLVTPCHRVVASAGLGGFAKASDGYLVAAKRWLIQYEAGR
jgi:methylated-DNA-[protein]-cysteine S-methyltransferase